MADKARADFEPEIPGCTDVALVRAGTPRVFRCTRQGSGEIVSALVYPTQVDSGTAGAFAEQVLALGGVGHPHVAPVLDSGLADGFPYVISTPDAGTLAERMRSHLLAPADLAILGRYLAAGLAAIHSAGLVHGSLTPDAIVFGPDGNPMLSGLTLGLEQHTGHVALSSPRQLYIAPETLRDGTTTPISDLYALGAVLHAAISGKPPLAARMGETAGEHILRVFHEPPARLDVLPDQFAAILAQLLEKDPARRPRSAEAVAVLLADLRPEPVVSSASGGGSMPVVRPVMATQPTPSSRATADNATGTSPHPDLPTTSPLPRPALMNRSRLRSWPPSAPTAGASSDTTQPLPLPDAPPTHQQPTNQMSTSAQQPTKQLPANQPPDDQMLASAPPPNAAPLASPLAGGRPQAPAAEWSRQSMPLVHGGPGAGGPGAGGPGAGGPGAGGPGVREPDNGPGDGGGPGGGQDDQEAEPEPRRGRGWLLLAVSVAVAAALIAVLAMVNRQDPPQTAAPSPKPSPRPTPTISVLLDAPADHDTYVDLKWTGDHDLTYVLVVAQVGQKAATKVLYKRTKYRVPVVPGVQYCFVVQATNGIDIVETKPLPIRNAQCEK